MARVAEAEIIYGSFINTVFGGCGDGSVIWVRKTGWVCTIPCMLPSWLLPSSQSMGQPTLWSSTNSTKVTWPPTPRWSFTSVIAESGQVSLFALASISDSNSSQENDYLSWTKMERHRWRIDIQKTDSKTQYKPASLLFSCAGLLKNKFSLLLHSSNWGKVTYIFLFIYISIFPYLFRYKFIHLHINVHVFAY